MGNTKRLFILIVFIVLISKINVLAQTLQVGAVTEDFYRREQLLGQADTNFSFTVRPIFPQLSSTNPLATYYTDSVYRFGKQLTLQALPVIINMQQNTHHPYGWNDGPMIPAKGFQTYISAGIFAQFGPLSVQLRPEYITSQNSYFETFNSNQYDITFARYYDIYNNIDLPVRFGEQRYSRFHWGQSSVRLNYKAVSFGLSTENLWWGPGIRNSLLMSNNAPGFPHLTLNTLRPINTPAGSFEGQLISGRLSNSNFAPLMPADKFFLGSNLYVPKPDDWRYITGFVFTWQPKWVPGLFLGVNQVQQSYGKNLSGLSDYLPLFLPFSTASAPDNSLNQKDKITSGFMRWLWTKEHAEVYFEFGNFNNIRDLTQTFLSSGTSRAYTFGLRKLLPLGKSKDQNLLIGIEVTQLQENSNKRTQFGYSWYVSKSIRHGYTNQGEVIGAGIGPGANIQSLNVSWVKGLKRIGLQLERYAHNNDFYYYTFNDSKDYGRHWVDLSVALSGEWNYKNFIFNGKIQGINSLNYQWYTKVNNDLLFKNGRDVYNFQFQLGTTYRF